MANGYLTLTPNHLPWIPVEISNSMGGESPGPGTHMYVPPIIPRATFTVPLDLVPPIQLASLRSLLLSTTAALQGQLALVKGPLVAAQGDGSLPRTIVEYRVNFRNAKLAGSSFSVSRPFSVDRNGIFSFTLEIGAYQIENAHQSSGTSSGVTIGYDLHSAA